MFKFRNTERIEKLERAVEDLRKQPHELEIEWENYLNKFGQILARLNQRARQEALKAPESEEPEPDHTQPSPHFGEHQILSTMRDRHFGGRR